MDQATTAGTQNVFVRVCIEVEIDAELPLVVRMNMRGSLIHAKNGALSTMVTRHALKNCAKQAEANLGSKNKSPEAKLVEDNDKPQQFQNVNEQNANEETWNVVEGKKHG